MSQSPETAKPTPTAPAQVPFTAQSEYEPCQECGAPLDAQQRYCVNCAARRANGANPASRYFAAASRRARRPDSLPPREEQRRGQGRRGRLLRPAPDRRGARGRRRPQRSAAKTTRP